MSTSYRYALPVEQTEWKFDGHTEVTFTWEYDENRAGLLQLYSKGKQQQWDAADRIDWSLDLDPENPMELDDRVVPICGSHIWERMTETERRQLRHHQQASQISQFMHGEQGALIATAKIVQTVPDLDSKFYAATQVMDEARHVAFGRLALRDYYPQLTDAERAEREEFTVQACWHMRDRFNQKEVWERLGLPVDECIEILDHSETMQLFRSRLFTRIVPTVKDIGLWGRKVQEAFAAMGAIEFAKIDAAALLDNDARVAEDFDAKMRLKDASAAPE